MTTSSFNFKTLSNTLFLLSALCASFAQAANPKRGMAFPLDLTQPGDAAKGAGTQISWEYDWNVNAPPNLPAGIEHVPMQWGRDGIDGFQGAVKGMGAKVALGFNEPDIPEQSNIPAAEAATLWKQGIQPLAAAGVKLGSPAVSARVAPAGTQWLKDFIAACDGCTIDFIVVHWYGEGADNFISFVQDVHSQFPNKPIWITEFAESRADTGLVQAFLDQAINWLDGQDFVERYSWFAFSVNLLDANGNVNDLGKAYV
ncbi:hypothetical protein K435DRAFT_890370 [Dendrothele bispora CBS 962.96]|uniref:Asl1-like glycosyl hydrolase catalytic domain-containing protein n=1 Tax=Dendrothele bispora (strain CBS 962.96) TaxID=1314807 RepID=A0A4S8MRK6_DENBC|nr:hypothetical protein K435DRAFT_890370 [Dendrothele bispora CBS 962.96]